MRHLNRFGIGDLPVRRLELVESAREGRKRESVEQLLGDIKGGAVGIILLSSGCRLTRDESDGARLINAAGEASTLFIVKGEVLDPRDPFQHARLMEMIINARLDNADRAYSISSTAYDAVRSHKFMIPLPTGFLWAHPEDPTYRSMLEVERLGSWIAPDQLKLHKVTRNKLDRTYYVLPDPSPGLFRACMLVVRWLLDTRDPREVLHRIKHDPEYPMPGQFPLQRGRVFSGVLPPPIPLPASAKRLWVWCHSYALYGIYRFRSDRLRQFIEIPDPVYQLEGAFPALMNAEDREEILQILSQARRAYRSNGYKGPRNHILPVIRCSHVMSDGEPCGQWYYPTYQASKPCRYMGYGPYHRNHATAHALGNEDPVLEMVKEVFRPEAVAAAVRQLRRGKDDATEQRNGLEARIAELEQLNSRAMANYDAAVLARNSSAERAWYQRSLAHLAERDQRRAELQRLERSASLHKQLAEDDYAQILCLARDLGTLLEQARAVEIEEEARWRESGRYSPKREGLVRRIIQCLVREVQIRQLAKGIQYVEVEFRNGARAGRVHVSDPMTCTQPERAWIDDRVREGVDPATIAAELNHLRGKRAAMAPWTPRRIEVAVCLYRYVDPPVPRGRYRDATEIALEVDVAEATVMRAAFLGKLGVARVVRGALALRPTQKQLDQEFPTYALRRVARDKGWPLDDTTLVFPMPGVMECSRKALRSYVGRGDFEVARDAAGRLYARRSQMVLADLTLEAALARAPEELRRLDVRYWTRYEPLVQRIGPVARSHLKKELVILKCGRVNYYHCTPEDAERLQHRTLEAAVAALGNSMIRPEDFYPVTEAVELLRRAFGRGSVANLYLAGSSGHILRVIAWDRRPNPHRVAYFHIPATLLQEESPNAMDIWLQGRHSDTLSRCDCGRWPCREAKHP